MPFVDLHSADDYASIFYTTNTTLCNVGGFDPEKPTVCVLPPTFLDSSWLDQMDDPRLDSEYNLIAFDLPRCAGSRSECRPTGRHDSWTDAADLAFCARALALPPMHILAFEGISTNAALRFAALFPEMCLSLALCNVPPPTELMWIYSAYSELVQTWCFAEDLESYEHVANEAVTFTLGPNTSASLRDELIAYWEGAMHPQRRQRVIEQANLVMNRSPLPAAAYQYLTQPVLLIHGDANESAPLKYAERLAQSLKAVLYTVKGGAGYLGQQPGTSSIVNQVFVKFLSRLPKSRSDRPEWTTTVAERMHDALNTLELITGDSTLSTRNPMSSLSFSCLADGVVRVANGTAGNLPQGPDPCVLPPQPSYTPSPQEVF
ncbi:alpha/beta-hydrolase [Mycena amicta]|nr:alpha/beta-hydrolase [Mycena amicta]